MRPPHARQPPDGAGATTAAAYNYDRFHLEAYLDRESMTPDVTAGESAVDATVNTLDGDERRLSDLWADHPVVLEFGSITCPLFTGQVAPMERLAARYADEVAFYVLYVREAHPASRYPHHGSLEEKLAAARDCARAEDIVHRTVLVDGLDGEAHRAYGALPNSVYVIGTDGVIAYRADWNKHAELEAPLRALLDAGGRGGDVDAVSVERNFHRWRDPTKVLEALRVFKRAGLGSLVDFVREFPRILQSR